MIQSVSGAREAVSDECLVVDVAAVRQVDKGDVPSRLSQVCATLFTHPLAHDIEAWGGNGHALDRA